MAERPDSPRLGDVTQSRGKLALNASGPLIDSDNTPKSLTRRFQSVVNAPPTSNLRKSQRTTKGKNVLANNSMDSTDDEYFTHPVDPKELKKMTKTNKKNQGCPTSKRLPTETSKSDTQARHNSSTILSHPTPKSSDIENFNTISKFLNDQTE